MKKENTKSPNKAVQQEEDRWIDVHNDDVMREMGFFRPFNQAPRDESVWTKTPYERRILQSVKHSCNKNEDMHFHSTPAKFIRVPGKLIIQLKKNRVYPKTTYSTKCWQSDIPSILAQYVITNHKLNITESVVAKYTWNGKTYYPGELPFWGK